MNQPGTLNTESTGVAPLMAEQPPVVVVPGGERQVDRLRHGPSAYGGGGPAPLGRRRFQCTFFWFFVFVFASVTAEEPQKGIEGGSWF